MDKIYHYTSVDTLALILKNKTIRLNNLADMDDLQEGDTQDLGKLGRFIYSSSWTKDPKESIPLWNLYTPNMSGVRICMREELFDEEVIDKDEIKNFCNSKVQLSDEQLEVESIPFTKGLWDIQKSNNIYFPQFKVKFLKVKYDMDKFKIKPKVFDGNTIALGKLGQYKDDVWSFQKEWRFILLSYPIKLPELLYLGMNNQEKIYQIMSDENTVNLKAIDLPINEKNFKEMEILCGPKVSAGQRIIIQDLVDKYNISATIKESKLKIR